MKAAVALRRADYRGGYSSMAHDRRSKICAPLLQREVDRIVDSMPSLDGIELSLKLALHRLHFLTWQERLLLLERISRKEDFLSLGLAEIESFLYRSMHTQSLDMAKVWEYAERDAEFSPTGHSIHWRQ
jgi:hypothetical protein